MPRRLQPDDLQGPALERREIGAGSPFGPVAPSYLDALNVGGGDFTYNFPTEPPPGATFALTLTGIGTSEFATVTGLVLYGDRRRKTHDFHENSSSGFKKFVAKFRSFL